MSLTPAELQNLRDNYAELILDHMSTQQLEQFVYETIRNEMEDDSVWDILDYVDRVYGPRICAELLKRSRVPHEIVSQIMTECNEIGYRE